MARPTLLNLIELRHYIEFLRADLFHKAKTFGLAHEKTLEASRELDYFLYEYQKMAEDAGEKEFVYVG